MNCLQRKKGIIGKLNGIVIFFDKCSFWWVGILLLAVTFLPYLILGGGSVFEIHDQLDETILTYVLNARHLGDGTDVFPELLGGVNKTVCSLRQFSLFPCIVFCRRWQRFFCNMLWHFSAVSWGCTFP